MKDKCRTCKHFAGFSKFSKSVNCKHPKNTLKGPVDFQTSLRDDMSQKEKELNCYEPCLPSALYTFLTGSIKPVDVVKRERRLTILSAFAFLGICALAGFLFSCGIWGLCTQILM